MMFCCPGLGAVARATGAGPPEPFMHRPAVMLCAASAVAAGPLACLQQHHLGEGLGHCVASTASGQASSPTACCGGFCGSAGVSFFCTFACCFARWISSSKEIMNRCV